MQFFYPASSVTQSDNSSQSLIRPTAVATILTMLSTTLFFALTAHSGGHDHMYTAFVVLVPIEFYFFYVTVTFAIIVGGKLTGSHQDRRIEQQHVQDIAQGVVHVKSQNSIPSLPDYDKALKLATTSSDVDPSTVYFEAPPTYAVASASGQPPPAYATSLTHMV
ncbi:hypothetical protein AAVH_35804 [Aphelenchoides avenae]|nr:hypothetical protein AAVH_35804 [Aphelenchus avenae]